MKKELGIFTLLLVLCGVTAAINPRFLSVTNLTNMANIIGLFGIFSLGLGIVIITGGIDLSVGSMFALAGVLLSMFLTEIAWPFASWESTDGSAWRGSSPHHPSRPSFWFLMRG